MVAVNPAWIDGVALDAFRLRRIDSLMVMNNGQDPLGARTGILPGSNSFNVTVSGTTITVGTGITSLYYAGQGTYRIAITAASFLTMDAPHATLPRIDLVYLRVWDNSIDASGLNKADVVYLAGTPSSSPSAPTPAGTQIFMRLAHITVPASDGGSPTVNTTVRPVTVAPGGILPTATAPSNPYVGQYYDTGTDLLRWNGSSWDTYQKVVNIPWIQPALATGYAHNGNGNGNVRYRLVTVDGTKYVEWRGGLGITYSGNALQNSGNFLRDVLPASYWPADLQSIVVACSFASSSSLAVKVDFRVDGTVLILGPTTATNDTYATPVIRPPWLSLNGVRYPVA
ncbi:hypothetical protein ACIREM_32700 [Streptomyces shenzhenensis]|uniref:hypothetical protein n=1 Tax=Streptomyces shenzhenensis TaxID=943815 RepID=UPI0038100A61